MARAQERDTLAPRGGRACGSERGRRGKRSLWHLKREGDSARPQQHSAATLPLPSGAPISLTCATHDRWRWWAKHLDTRPSSDRHHSVANVFGSAADRTMKDGLYWPVAFPSIIIRTRVSTVCARMRL